MLKTVTVTPKLVGSIHTSTPATLTGVWNLASVTAIRPTEFGAALPGTVKVLAVLDRTKEPGAAGEPLYEDVVTALAEQGRTVKVVGGRYGLSSKEFTPAMVKGIFDELKQDAPKNHFTIGITEPFEGPQGDKIWGTYTLPASTTAQFVINDACKYPAAAARWVDHWYSDEGIIAYVMGVEGVTYEKDENSPGGLKLTDFVVKNPGGINFVQVLATYVP